MNSGVIGHPSTSKREQTDLYTEALCSPERVRAMQFGTCDASAVRTIIRTCSGRSCFTCDIYIYFIINLSVGFLSPTTRTWHVPMQCNIQIDRCPHFPCAVIMVKFKLDELEYTLQLFYPAGPIFWLFYRFEEGKTYWYIRKMFLLFGHL